MSQTGLETFDDTLQQTNTWLNDVAEQLGRDDRQLAYHALRATLQTLRDRIGTDEAAKLAAQLPLLVRGIFYESWDPGEDPAALRDREAFLERIHARYGYREPVSTEEIARAVFVALNARLTPGLVEKVRERVGADVRGFWPAPAAA